LNGDRMVALDGYTGEVFFQPDEITVKNFDRRINFEQNGERTIQQLKNRKVIAPDGTEVEIFANCNDPSDIKLAINNGAQGIGLVRSEILFMSTTYNLTLESQIEFYSECIRAAQGRPITIRTFDIGADKPLESLELEKEPNPALGLRGVRLMYTQPQIFETQIEALQIAADRCGYLNVMIPMISTVEDVVDYMVMVERVKARLLHEEVISTDKINWGIMIETPAAAVMSDTLARYVNFFSIGTNDLTQYTMAADRLNPNAARYYNPAHPAVVKLVEMTAESANRWQIKVSVCGESAADFESAKVYIEKGVRTLSMAPKAMPVIKQRLLEEFSSY
ncbi:MAG: phosphoenolpyruvate--protein phosphotransferase, partial [Oscillospiraceae bacterium]|nr:phosphoenolpyruvate--protein phosphotransferase [Oscillospiraceae bacterium]